MTSFVAADRCCISGRLIYRINERLRSLYLGAQASLPAPSAFDGRQAGMPALPGH